VIKAAAKAAESSFSARSFIIYINQSLFLFQGKNQEQNGMPWEKSKIYLDVATKEMEHHTAFPKGKN
jgi:hypothetical protein